MAQRDWKALYEQSQAEFHEKTLKLARGIQQERAQNEALVLNLENKLNVQLRDKQELEERLAKLVRFVKPLQEKVIQLEQSLARSKGDKDKTTRLEENITKLADFSRDCQSKTLEAQEREKNTQTKLQSAMEQIEGMKARIDQLNGVVNNLRSEYNEALEREMLTKSTNIALQEEMRKTIGDRQENAENEQKKYNELQKSSIEAVERIRKEQQKNETLLIEKENKITELSSKVVSLTEEVNALRARSNTLEHKVAGEQILGKMSFINAESQKPKDALVSNRATFAFAESPVQPNSPYAPRRNFSNVNRNANPNSNVNMNSNQNPNSNGYRNPNQNPNPNQYQNQSQTQNPNPNQNQNQNQNPNLRSNVRPYSSQSPQPRPLLRPNNNPISSVAKPINNNISSSSEPDLRKAQQNRVQNSDFRTQQNRIEQTDGSPKPYENKSQESSETTSTKSDDNSLFDGDVDQLFVSMGINPADLSSIQKENEKPNLTQSNSNPQAKTSRPPFSDNKPQRPIFHQPQNHENPQNRAVRLPPPAESNQNRNQTPSPKPTPYQTPNQTPHQTPNQTPLSSPLSSPNPNQRRLQPAFPTSAPPTLNRGPPPARKPMIKKLD